MTMPAAERLRRRVRDIVMIPSPPGDKLGRVFDVTIVSLIVLNTAAVIVETLPSMQPYASWFFLFEVVSVGVFIAEYALRLWSVTANPDYAHPIRGRLKWMATPMAVIDLLAIVPIFLFALDLRFLRVLRVLRILKLSRYSESTAVLANVMRRSRSELVTSLFLVILALILTSGFMYYAERDAQPEKFGSIPETMWWSIVALTTTGYGDVVPVTALGRVMGGLTAILGVASIALPVGILSSAFVQEIEARRTGKVEPCPHCGKDIHSTGAKL